MDGRILVPWEQNRDNAPASLTVEVFDGHGDPPPDVLDDVVFYVVPYGRDQRVDLIPRMPRLRAVQLLTAGYEHALPYLPAGVRLYNGRGLHDASTAEHAVALILAAQRDLFRWAEDQRSHVWNRTRRAPCGISSAHRGIRQYRRGHRGAAAAFRSDRGAVCAAGPFRSSRWTASTSSTYPPSPRNIAGGGLRPGAPRRPKEDSSVPLNSRRCRTTLSLVNVGRGPAGRHLGALLAERGGSVAALDVTDRVAPARPPAVETLRAVLITPHVAGGIAAFCTPCPKVFVA